MPEILPQMYTERFCDHLEELDRGEAIRAIHAAWLQLQAIGARVYSERLGTDVDNTGTIEALRACLQKAGHAGFTK